MMRIYLTLIIRSKNNGKSIDFSSYLGNNKRVASYEKTNKFKALKEITPILSDVKAN